jgi:hypothetical protein
MAMIAAASLMSPQWQVVFAQNVDGVDVMDTLSFTSTTISSTHQVPTNDPGLLNHPSPWGSWSLTSDLNRITGTTIKGDSFCIDYIPSTGSRPDYLICSMDSSQTWNTIRALGAGAAAGAGAGGLVGGALHDLLVGLLAGLIAGAAAAVIYKILAGTGPKATWVATDGGAGGLQVEDIPREAPALRVMNG